MKSQSLLLFVGASTLLISGCSNGDLINNGSGSEGVVQRIDVTVQERETISQYNNFAWRLYQQVIADNPQENKVISPLSMSLAIGMLANGASAEATHEILSVLGMEGSDVNRLNSINTKLASSLETVDSKIKLSLANSFWYNSSMIHPYGTFTNILSENYDAESIGFIGYPVGQINKWIEKSTGGMIKDVLGESDITDVCLINATYFKGIWTEKDKFDPKNTKKDTFHDYAGTVSYGSFMQNSTGYRFCETEEAQHISLAMGSEDAAGSETFLFNIILPKEESSIEKSLQEMVSGARQMLYLRPTTLRMPKFDAEFKDNVVDNLKQLGLEKTFSSICEGIADEPVRFNVVQHGATISVDEEGATAAAATVIGSSTSPGDIDLSPIEITLDRPFVYYITEQSTGSILFIGHVAHL